MNRRRLLQAASAMGLAACTPDAVTNPAASRVRPGDAAWPSEAQWAALNQAVEGTLVKVAAPATADGLGKRLRNPYYIGDEVALTQTSGWVDAWRSAPSSYAVAARGTAHVVAAVNFAREHNLRLVIKGGGHSYQGTSCAADSLLLWTRAMNGIALHDDFVARGCTGVAPQPAVTLGAGVLWGAAYDAVATRGGRYVQGGGCLTVGVAGLVQSGGFGSFSKTFGLAAAALLEAEVVTADGTVRIANACSEPDLFWGLKGGGGGGLGVITRLTLRTRDLPASFGVALGRIKAHSDAAYQRLIARMVDFYGASLFNRHWGEQLVFRTDNSIRVSMVFQGLDQREAEAVWEPLRDWLAASPRDFTLEEPLRIVALPARHLWDAAFLRQNAPAAIVADDRPGAPEGNFFWAGDGGQVGWLLHGYRSAWLPAGLLRADRQARLAEALFAATRSWEVSLHVNKGLAGAPDEALAAARDTATNPAVLDAFALAIIAGAGAPAFPGLPGAAPDLDRARARARAIDRAMDALLRVAPDAGSYVSESDYFERDWQRAFWGSNYPRLAAVKRRYDPNGLFFAHHGVGSESWSADGFTRLA